MTNDDENSLPHIWIPVLKQDNSKYENVINLRKHVKCFQVGWEG